jgi:diaminopimelate decarboxylase
VLRLLADCGSGFDVVSGGELHRVLSAGGSPSKTVYAGVGKTVAEIRYALQSGVRMLNVESPGELRQIEEVARELGSKASVAIRVNPDVDPHTHEKTTTGTKQNKFGISISGTLELVAQVRGWDHVEIRGIHMHLGGPIYSPEPYEQALVKIVDLVGALRSRGCAIDAVNMGGGYPISYTGEEVPGPEEYASAVERFLEKLKCEVIIEPGRYISGPSGLLLVRVLYRKESQHGKNFVVCDGGMS